MLKSLKQISRNAGRSRTASSTAPRPARLRARLCGFILVGLFSGIAFAQSAVPGVASNPKLISQLHLIDDSDSILPEEPGQPVDPPSPRLQHSGQPQPGDYEFTPLNTGQRADLFFRGFLASPVSYLGMATSAGANWIASDPKGWGRTFGGYGERAGTEFLLYTSQEVVHDAGDAVMGLDPRYFPCRCSGLLQRSGHALAMTLLAYDGNGNLRLDLPRFAGDYGSSMLVTTMYPSGYSPLVQGVKMGHVQVGLDAGLNLFHEFSPEFKRLGRALRIVKAEPR